MRLAALAFIALASCNAPAQKSGDALLIDAESRWELKHPVGAFTMMPNPGGEGFIVLNTRSGLVRHCDRDGPAIRCGQMTDVKEPPK